MSVRETQQTYGKRGPSAAASRRISRRVESLARFLSTLPDVSSAGIAFLDLEWRYIYVNQALADINGSPVKEHIGRSAAELVPDIWAKAEPAFRQVVGTGEAIDNIAFEGETPAQPGVHRHWLESLFPVLSEGGEVMGVGAIVIETSQERRREEELHRSQERFRVAQEISLDGFTILQPVRDEEGTIVDFVCEYANPTTERILHRGQLQGQRLLEVLPLTPQLQELFARSVSVVESGQSDKSEQYWDLGELKGWFRNVAVKLGDGVALSFADITVSKGMEEELRRANAAKDEVLGLVSHELKTPLTTVVGIANVLERRFETLDEQQLRELVTQLAADARNLQSTIENMLLLARADGEAADIEPILAQRLAEAFVAEHNERHAGSPVNLEVEDSLPPVCGRKAWFEHVLSNLVGNAVKYAPAGSEILVRVRRWDSGVAVEVCDRGPGLDPDEITEIFKPFFRSIRAKERATGAGLGLSVSRRLVELQGGHISAMPREGGGLTVRFVLPVMNED